MTAPGPEPTRRGEPPGEIEIDERLVRRLLEDQHPDLSGEPLDLLTNGWDNCTFRLGTDLAVRLPRRQVAAALIRHEQRWLPEIARRVSVPIPAPVRIGEPSAAYPWGWSVVPWFEGVSSEYQSLDPSEADVLGRFLSELHVAAPPDAPANPYRGVPLAERRASFEERLASVEPHLGGLDRSALRGIWSTALSAPLLPQVPEECPGVWLHGDLHPKNVIVREGRLSAVIDWGDLTAGDPASDLASAWLLFPVEAHERLWSSYGVVTEECWSRARGWALLFGLIFLDAGLESDPAFASIGRSVLTRVLETRTRPHPSHDPGG